MGKENPSVQAKIIAANLIIAGLTLLVGSSARALRLNAPPHLAFALIAVFACGLAMVFGGCYLLTRTTSSKFLDGLTLDDPVAIKGPAIIITILVAYFLCFDLREAMPPMALAKGSPSWLTPVQCLSYSWLHSTVPHLVGNSTALLFFWLLGYNRLREAPRWCAFIFGLYGAGWVSFFCDPYTTVGCSGGVTALIGLTLYETLRTGRSPVQGLCFLAGILGFVIPSFIASGAAHLDHSAHLAGLIIGAGIGWIFDPTDDHLKWMRDKPRTAARLGKASKMTWSVGAVGFLLYSLMRK